MISVRARVRNGRLVVDEPTDLPDGTELELVPLEVDLDGPLPTAPPLTPEESARVAATLKRGNFISAEELRAKLAANSKG
jgi:hypothetical protein